jgi:hypothetical protein
MKRNSQKALRPRKPAKKRVEMEEDRLTTEELAREIVPEGELWLDQPNLNLGLRTPRELIGTSEEIEIRNMLLAAKYGVYG